MTGAEVYLARGIKRRRATQSEMATRRRRIYEIAETERPASVRQIYYQTVVQKVSGIEKDDAGYDKVQDLLTDLRRGGVVPFEWIIDEGRYAQQPTRSRVSRRRSTTRGATTVKTRGKRHSNMSRSGSRRTLSSAS